MAPRTLGVEEEFLLFERSSARLLDRGPAIAADAGGERFQKELMKAQAEHASPVCESLDELAARLAGQRDELAAAADGHGGRLVASATCPVADRTPTTEDDRYEDMAERFAAVAREELTCAMHVHVSIESPDEGVRVVDRIAPWLHLFVALSANSPFRDGRDTGYAAYRRLVWGLWPTSGPTAPFRDLATYRATVDELVAGGGARDSGMIYFDARLSAEYPTVEIRVCDVVHDLRDAVTIAGLLRALVSTVAAENGAPLARIEVLHGANWRAARYGMSDTLADLAAAEHRLVPAWDLVERLLSHVDGALAAAGDRDRVREGLAAIHRRGTGERRQRAAADRGGVRALVDAMTITGDRTPADG
jgi:carboxylate-amine ligase